MLFLLALPIVDYNNDDVVQHAANHSGQDPSMFSQAMQYAQNQPHQDVDEQQVMNAHQQAYSQGNAGSLDAGGMGSAAAMQALSHFTQGGGK